MVLVVNGRLRHWQDLPGAVAKKPQRLLKPHPGSQLECWELQFRMWANNSELKRRPSALILAAVGNIPTWA